MEIIERISAGAGLLVLGVAVLTVVFFLQMLVGLTAAKFLDKICKLDGSKPHILHFVVGNILWAAGLYTLYLLGGLVL